MANTTTNRNHYRARPVLLSDGSRFVEVIATDGERIASTTSAVDAHDFARLLNDTMAGMPASMAAEDLQAIAVELTDKWVRQSRDRA